jgi:hypothetical protein
MSAELRIVAEVVQVRMLRGVSGYGRRGTIAEVGLDVAAGLMENRLAEYIGVVGFLAEEVSGGVEGEAEPGGGPSAGDGRRKTRGRRSNQVDAEQGEGANAG